MVSKLRVSVHLCPTTPQGSTLSSGSLCAAKALRALIYPGGSKHPALFGSKAQPAAGPCEALSHVCFNPILKEGDRRFPASP